MRYAPVQEEHIPIPVGQSVALAVHPIEEEMTTYIWMSFPLAVSDPRPPAIPAPELTTLYTIDKDGASVHVLKVASHTGTHVDAPGHVDPDGISIGAWAPSDLIFTRPVVVDLRAADDEVIEPGHLHPHERKLQEGDLALLRFGLGALRGTDPERFSRHSPGLGVAAARWLRRQCPQLRALGMDVPSLSCIAHLEETMAGHNELLGGVGRRFLVVEDMDLHNDLAGLREVRISPWRVEGMDSAPCSIVGIL
jgi:kynurenine formamidase